jgi:hypothetical protein
MREIKKNGVILARLIEETDIKKGLNFFSEDQEFVQVGVWGHYENGKYLQNHVHNEFERTATRTYEALYMVSGSMDVEIFDLDCVHVETFNIHKGEILILMECGHGYTITEDDTTVLEIKNGPFAGVDKDKVKF